MSFVEEILEHSKKVGRISALFIILGVAGTISIIGVANDPSGYKDVLKDWLALGGIALAFYFLSPKAAA